MSRSGFGWLFNTSPGHEPARLAGSLCVVFTLGGLVDRAQPLASRVMKSRVARRREPFLSGTKAYSSRSQEHTENANHEGDESAHVGVWTPPTPPHMPASFLAVVLFSSLLGDSGPRRPARNRGDRGPRGDGARSAECSRRGGCRLSWTAIRAVARQDESRMLRVRRSESIGPGVKAEVIVTGLLDRAGVGASRIVISGPRPPAQSGALTGRDFGCGAWRYGEGGLPDCAISRHLGRPGALGPAGQGREEAFGQRGLSRVLAGANFGCPLEGPPTVNGRRFYMTTDRFGL